MNRHDQAGLAEAFAALHVPGDPVVLYNVWDVGSAKAVRDAGARAVATGSWSVAAANGFDDGEGMPLERVIDVIGRIVAAVDLPVTLDFESGYARGGRALEDNVRRVIDTGVVGINFEDQWIGEDAIYCVEEQTSRIKTVRRAAGAAGVPLFINARTDLFLRSEPARHADLVDEAIARGKAYAAAGASGFFAAGLRDEKLIERVCRGVALPVNVLFHPDLPTRDRLAQAGVARISYGPRPYREMMAWLVDKARGVSGT